MRGHIPHQSVQAISMRRRRHLGSIIGLSKPRLLIIIASLLVGGFALAMLAVNLLIDRAMGQPGETTAKYFPADTQVYFTINLRPGASQISKARNVFSIFENTSGFEDQREDLVGDLDDETGIDLRDDVAPWIGKDITFASFGASSPLDSQWVVLLQTNDRKASERFLDKLRLHLEGQQSFRFEKAGYQDGSLIYDEENEHAGFGLTDKYALVGSDSDVIRSMIRQFVSPPSNPLSEEKTFVGMIDHLSPDRFMLLFVRDGGLHNYGSIMDSSILDTLVQYIPEAAGLSASFTDTGIQLVLYLEEPQVDELGAQHNFLHLASVLPEDTLLMVSGTNVAGIWQSLRGTLRDRNDYRGDRIDHAFDVMEDELGISVEAQLIGQLTGETSLAVLPASGGTGGSIFQGLALAEVGDTGPFLTALEKLTSFLEDEEGLRTGRVALGDYEAVTLDLTDQGEGVRGYSPGYLITGDQVALGTTLQALSTVIETLEGRRQSLNMESEFSRLKELTPGNTSMYVFADITGLINLVADSLPSNAKARYENEIHPFLVPFRSMLLAGTCSVESTEFHLVLTVEDTR